MAIKYAIATGNWSSTSTWNGGTLPTSADDVYSNTFTVTIDTSPTVLSISNAATTGVTVGGTFVPTNGITLTLAGSGVGGGAASTACFTSSLGAGSSCLIVGNVSGGTVAGSTGVSNASTGTIAITGSCTGGAQSGANGIANLGAGTLSLTGACNGGSHASAVVYGALNSGTGTINITGACIAGSGTNANAFVNAGSGTINQAGSLTPGPSVSAVGPGSATQVTILSGPFLTIASGINPVMALRWFWANSSVSPTYYQIRTANLATIRPLYTADSVGGNPSVANVRSGTVYGPSSELTGTLAVPPAGSVALGVPVDNTTGTAYITASDITTAATNALTAASAVTLNQQITTLTTPGSIGERMKTSATVATVSQQLSDALSSRV